MCIEGVGKVVLEVEGGRAIVKVLGLYKVVIYCNYGLFMVGVSVDEVVWWYVMFECIC